MSWNVTVPDTFAESHLSAAVAEQRPAATQRGDSKNAKRQSITDLKTHIIFPVFLPNKSPISTISLEINNSIINRVENCKYLGVIIDDQLKWSTHIESVEQKLQRLIGILYKIRYKLPNWCLRDIYFAFVHSNILYGLEVYGNTYVSYLDKLTTLNNKILRILQKKGRCCNDCLYHTLTR